MGGTNIIAVPLSTNSGGRVPPVIYAHGQTDRQTNRHYENNGHLAVNQSMKFYALFQSVNSNSETNQWR